jgi:hypothetical protein
VIVFITTILSYRAKAQDIEFTPKYFLDSLQSIDQLILQSIDKFATPEYYQRKNLLRSFQRRGYAGVLLPVCRQDGLSALIAYLKMKLQIDYSLNHAPIFFRTSMNGLIPLPIGHSPSILGKGSNQGLFSLNDESLTEYCQISS